MKGFSLEYIFYVIIFLAFILVSISIIKNISNKPPEIKDITLNNSYLCSYLNNTEIGKKDLEQIIYGFINGFCNNFYFSTKQPLSISEIESMIKKVNKDYNVIVIKSCDLTTINSKTIFVNFDYVEKGRKIYLYRREIIYSDILMCLYE